MKSEQAPSLNHSELNPEAPVDVRAQKIAKKLAAKTIKLLEAGKTEQNFTSYDLWSDKTDTESITTALSEQLDILNVDAEAKVIHDYDGDGGRYNVLTLTAAHGKPVTSAYQRFESKDLLTPFERTQLDNQIENDHKTALQSDKMGKKLISKTVKLIANGATDAFIDSSKLYHGKADHKATTSALNHYLANDGVDAKVHVGGYHEGSMLSLTDLNGKKVVNQYGPEPGKRHLTRNLFAQKQR